MKRKDLTETVLKTREHKRGPDKLCLTCYKPIVRGSDYSELHIKGVWTIAHYNQDSKCHVWHSEKMKELFQLDREYRLKKQEAYRIC